MRRFFAWVAVVWLAAAGAAFAAEPAKQPGMLGVQMRDLTKEEADKLGFEQPTGVWVDKPVEGGAAEKAGIQTGDVILLVDGVEIEGATKFREVVGSKGAGAEVKFRVLRQGRSRTLTATLAARPVEAAAASPAPPSPLQLMLDTGGNMGAIRALAWTPDGKQLVSAGLDMAIRVWDANTGKTLRIIRGELGANRDGVILAMALSPDGRWLAVGGSWSKDLPEPFGSIRLYDFATGKLTRVLKGHDSVVAGLAFSPDSKKLISGGGNSTAIIWDASTGDLVHRLKGHTGLVCAVGFSPDGMRAVTGSNDTTLKLWQVDSGKIISTITSNQGKACALAIHPRDGTIVSGGYGANEIRLWDGKTGDFRSKLDTMGSKTDYISSLAIDPGGTRIISGMVTNERKKIVTVYIRDFSSGHIVGEYADHDGFIAAVAYSPDGRWVATAGGNNQAIRIWEVATSSRRNGPDGKVLDFAGSGVSVNAVGFSEDETSIAWGNTLDIDESASVDEVNYNERGPLEVLLRLVSARTNLAEPKELTAVSSSKVGHWRRAVTSVNDIEINYHGSNYNVLDVTRKGKATISLNLDAPWHCFTLTPDGKTIVAGRGARTILTFEVEQIEVAASSALNNVIESDYLLKIARSFDGHQDFVWALATSSDGRYLVSGGDDQTVRLWSLKTRELLMTLFRGADGQWIAWTPQGYYTGSPGADALIGWQLNKGADQTPAYYSADQLRRQFNRPDIVSKAIVLASAEEAVRTSEGTNFKLDDLIKRPPPRVAITSPVADAALSGGETVVTIHIEPTPDPVRKLTVRINGRTIHEQAVGSAAGDIKVKVPLAKGADVITVIAGNEVGDTTAEVRVTHAGEGRLDQRGVLYVVAVGVDTYANLNICGDDKKSSCDLRFAGADASSFADTIKRTLGSQHAKVDVQLLTGTAATKPTANNIRDALQRVRNLATETDTVLVFTAGHGVNDGADYLFLTADATKEGRGWRGSTVLKWTELESVIFGAHGARFLFVDTCHSSGAYNAKLGNEAFHNDVTAFTATGPEELALEFGELKHGLFTYAIAEGLGARAKEAASGGNEVRASALAAYLAKRTSALIDQYSPDYVAIEKRPKPVPRMFRARDAADHVLARVE